MKNLGFDDYAAFVLLGLIAAVLVGIVGFILTTFPMAWWGYCLVFGILGIVVIATFAA